MFNSIWNKSLAVGGLMVLLTVSSGALLLAQQRSSKAVVDMRSGLLGVSPKEIVIVRVVETNKRAPVGKVVITYLDSRDRIVAVRSGSLKPGAPVIAEAQGELFGRGARGAVRMLVKIEVEDLALSQPVTTVEFFEPFDLAFRGGPVCGPGASATGPQFNCPEYIVDLTLP